jgi:hypothetical protein
LQVVAQRKSWVHRPVFFHCGAALEKAIAQWIEERDKP